MTLPTTTRTPGAAVRRRRLIVLLAGLLAALIGLTVAAPAASAHAALLSTAPADAEIDAIQPTRVSLTFGEAVTTGLGAIQVLAADGSRADTGQVEQPPDRHTVEAPLHTGVQDGTYVVLWRVVSADSHPVSGSFTFSVGHPTKVTGYQGRITPPHDPGLLLGATRAIGFTGLMLWLGGALFCLALWQDGTRHRAVRRLILLGLVAELVTAAAALLLQGPYAAGLSSARAFEPDLVRAVLQTRYGHATALRAGLALVALLTWAGLKRAPGPTLAVQVVLGVDAAITWTAAGHSGTGTLQPYAALLDVTHLLATSAWIGGLAVLGLGLRGRWDRITEAQLLPQWSRVATWAVALLVLSGTFASYRQVRTPGALATPYGFLLILKVFLVLMMLVAGYGGREWVRRNYGVLPRRFVARRQVPVAHAAIEPERGAGPAQQVPVPADGPPPARDQHAFLRESVRNETGIALVVLLVTAVLVQTPPAANAYAPPYTGTSAAGPYKVQVDFYPAHKGLNELHLYTLGPSGRTQDVDQVTGVLTRDDGSSLTVRPGHKSLGHYEDLHVVIPASGHYTLTLQLRTSDTDSYGTTQMIVVH